MFTFLPDLCHLLLQATSPPPQVEASSNQVIPTTECNPKEQRKENVPRGHGQEQPQLRGHPGKDRELTLGCFLACPRIWRSMFAAQAYLHAERRLGHTLSRFCNLAERTSKVTQDLLPEGPLALRAACSRKARMRLSSKVPE
jgi:hypothetical protein